MRTALAELGLIVDALRSGLEPEAAAQEIERIITALKWIYLETAE